MPFTANDLIDVIVKALQEKPGAHQATPVPPPKPPPPRRWKYVRDPAPKGRPFLTETQIRKALTPGKRHLTIPRDAIISPLALDWLAFRGVDIVRE